jgi:glucose/mannose transport system substrate-binding protein
MDKKQINRRQFISVAAVGVASTAVLAACGATPTATPVPQPTAAAAPAAPAAPAGGPSGKLEIFSWWTSGGEVEALNALYKVFSANYPNVTVVNAAIGGGGTASGGDMKAVLQTRMMGGDPPESFQVHLGGELQDPYIVNGLVLPVDDIYTSENYVNLFPKTALDTARYKGHYWSVPVNIHRANMFWYNKTVAGDNGITTFPTTWEDFMTMGDKLKAKGIPPMVINENAPGGYSLIMESVFIQYLGADKWAHLFDGGTPWSDPAIETALNTGLKLLDYLQPTYLNDDWNTVNDMVMKGKALGIPNGDWIPGIYWAAKFTDFLYAENPGCTGIYMALADSFPLPKGCKNPDAAVAWLKTCGSKAGQDAFNPIKGSISARSDSDPSVYSDEQRWMMQQWAKETIVPSITHGSAAKVSFMTDYMNITNQFAAKKTDVATTWKNLQTAAANAKFGA